MNKKIYLISALAGLIIFVGAGCAKTDDQPKVVIEKTVNTYLGEPDSENKYTFRHECFGTIVPVKSATYCQGKNVLAVSKNNGEWKTLQENDVTFAGNAFILVGEPIIVIVRNKPDAPLLHILLSYDTRSCLLDDDNCGAGTVEFEDTLDFNAQDMTLRTLKRFPGSGNFSWDTAGHAAYVRNTCGGAGCGAVPVSIFDLTTDAVRVVTTDEAVSDIWFAEEKPDAKTFPPDISGASLPYWSNLSYSQKEVQWHIIKHNPDGSTKNVSFAWVK